MSPAIHVMPDSQSCDTISDTAFRTLSRLLQDETGIVLTDAKRGLAVSRLQRRLRKLGLPDFEAYASIVSAPKGATELQEMIHLLTTNVTRFFREPHHFRQLSDAILPDLLEKSRRGQPVRIWSAGCATGEEPYSIAMTILTQDSQAGAYDIKILATDIDRNVLEIGKAGRYRMSERDRSEHPELASFLKPAPDKAGLFEVDRRARDMVQFGELNLLRTWPMKGRFDVIFCRNVVIYFGQDTQQSLWPRFADALLPGGHLIIGHSERVSGPAQAHLQSSGITQYERQRGGADQ